MIAVGFDFDHTLGIDNKLERKAFVQIARTHTQRDGHHVDDERSGAAIDAALADFRGGRVSVDDALHEAFTSVFGHDSASAVADFKNLAVAMVPRFVQALPGVRDVLGKLDAAGVTHAILTNGWSPLQESKAAAVGAFCRVLVSERIGTRKPLPEAFFQLSEALETRLEEIWFVGDDPRVDIAGALDAGMTGVWFNWEKRAYPAGLPKPTHTIYDINELTELLMMQNDVGA